MFLIQESDELRIVKDGTCFFETNLMFLKIASGFFGILLKM